MKVLRPKCFYFILPFLISKVVHFWSFFLTTLHHIHRIRTVNPFSMISFIGSIDGFKSASSTTILQQKNCSFQLIGVWLYININDVTLTVGYMDIMIYLRGSKVSQTAENILVYVYLPQQLGILLKCAKSNLTTASKSHLAGCALFVCNKWDRIKPEEQDEVKKEQIQKLSKKIDNLDPKSQIVYLSCMTAQQAQSYGYITEDFHDLITGISNLLVSSMKNNLRMHYMYVNHKVDLTNPDCFDFHVSYDKSPKKKTIRSVPHLQAPLRRASDCLFVFCLLAVNGHVQLI